MIYNHHRKQSQDYISKFIFYYIDNKIYLLSIQEFIIVIQIIMQKNKYKSNLIEPNQIKNKFFLQTTLTPRIFQTSNKKLDQSKYYKFLLNTIDPTKLIENSQGKPLERLRTIQAKMKQRPKTAREHHITIKAVTLDRTQFNAQQIKMKFHEKSALKQTQKSSNLNISRFQSQKPKKNLKNQIKIKSIFDEIIYGEKSKIKLKTHEDNKIKIIEKYNKTKLMYQRSTYIKNTILCPQFPNNQNQIKKKNQRINCLISTSKPKLKHIIQDNDTIISNQKSQNTKKRRVITSILFKKQQKKMKNIQQDLKPWENENKNVQQSFG